MKRICCGIGIVVHLCFMMLFSHLFGQEVNANKTVEDGGVLYIEAVALFKCRVVLPDDYNEGLATNKCIYIPFPQAVPAVAVIDPENCLFLRERKCKIWAPPCKVNAIDLYKKEEK